MIHLVAGFTGRDYLQKMSLSLISPLVRVRGLLETAPLRARWILRGKNRWPPRAFGIPSYFLWEKLGRLMLRWRYQCSICEA